MPRSPRARRPASTRRPSWRSSPPPRSRCRSRRTGTAARGSPASRRGCPCRAPGSARRARRRRRAASARSPRNAPERVAHAAEGLEDVGVVRLAADDEEHVGLLQEVPVADRPDRLHLLVGRVAAEVRRDDRRLASTSVTRLFAPPPKVGARIVPCSLMTKTSDCPWWVRSWFTSCSKADTSAANSWSGSPSRPPADRRGRSRT